MVDKSDFAYEHYRVDETNSKPLSRKKENIFLQHRMSHDKVWKMVDGDIIKMSDMSDRHLKASIAMLTVINQTHTKAYVGLIKELDGRHVEI